MRGRRERSRMEMGTPLRSGHPGIAENGDEDGDGEDEEENEGVDEDEEEDE